MPSVTLRASVSRPAADVDPLNTRLRVEVTEAVGVDSNIFLAERYNRLIHSGLILENRFIAVAKPTDMDAFPVGAPVPDATTPPFFRVNCIDLLYNSPTQMIEDYETLEEEVRQLMKTLARLENLEVMGEVTITE